MKIKLDTEKLRYIYIFETITGAMVRDIIINNKDNKITFLVEEGQAGMAIGKNGSNIKNLRSVINKNIEIIEFSKDPIKFLSNIMRPIPIQAFISQKSDGRKVIYLKGNLRLIKGKIKQAKELLKKYFEIENVVVT